MSETIPLVVLTPVLRGVRKQKNKVTTLLGVTDSYGVSYATYGVSYATPLNVLSAAHPLFYLIVVCWIGGDGTWSPIRCLALSNPSLLSCYPPPTCFASCSPPTRLPYFLIVMHWLMSLPSRVVTSLTPIVRRALF